MSNTISLADIIIETLPFSPELLDWCKKYSKFKEALKNIYAEKFISLGAIVTSYPPSEDEVIGIYTYDYKRSNPIFKQDFIVNKHSLNKEFVLYTRNPKGSNKYVKDIKEFFVIFSKYGYYVEAHHLTYNQLPNQIKERGKDAMKLAEKLKRADIKKIPQEHIDKKYKEIMSVKNEIWYVKQKLKAK